MYDLVGDTSSSMVGEIENHTLGVLMTTPISTREILLSKLAGALWKQSEPFSLILSAASLTQIPALFIIYGNAFPPHTFPAIGQVVTVLMFALTLLRLPVEIFMVGALGQFVGLTTTGRGAAQATSIGLTTFYFLLINLPRTLPLDPFWRVMVEGVIPLLTAAATAWLFLTLTAHRLTSGDRA
jgi:ABC-type Na+ efflux pump permease subunit